MNNTQIFFKEVGLCIFLGKNNSIISLKIIVAVKFSGEIQNNFASECYDISIKLLMNATNEIFYHVCNQRGKQCFTDSVNVMNTK